MPVGTCHQIRFESWLKRDPGTPVSASQSDILLQMRRDLGKWRDSIEIKINGYPVTVTAYLNGTFGLGVPLRQCDNCREQFFEARQGMCRFHRRVGAHVAPDWVVAVRPEVASVQSSLDSWLRPRGKNDSELQQA